VFAESLSSRRRGAEEPLDAFQKLWRVKGFGQIQPDVRQQLEHMACGCLGSEDEDRGSAQDRILEKDAARGNPVDLRHHNVQDNQIRLLQPRRFKPFLAVIADTNTVFRPAERMLQAFPNTRTLVSD